MTDQFLLNLAEYVGANEKIQVTKYLDEIRPFLRRYSECYRLWRLSDPKDVESFLSKNTYLSTTKDLDVIPYLAESGDHEEDDLVTLHSGIGFSPISILKRGLSTLTKEVDYVERVIFDNEYQKEIFLLKVDPSFEYWGVWNGYEIDLL